MNNEPNIDEWLKENFEQFSPEAPDVWQGISKGIQSAQAAQSGTGLTAAVKGSAMVVKIVTAVVAVTGLVTGYILYTQSEQQPESAAQPQIEQTLVPDQSAQQPETSQQTISSTNVQLRSDEPEKRIGKTMETDVVLSQPQAPETKQSISQPQSSPTNAAVDKPEVSPSTIDKPTTEVLTNQSKPEQPQAPVGKPEQPKQIVETKDTPQPQPAKLPYNPNEGESGFDKANIANVITPNNDGLNDRFVIEISNETLYHLIITDANGRMVFESYDKANNWDGKDQRTGAPCQPGDYRWVFQYQFKDADKQHTITGKLRLLN